MEGYKTPGIIEAEIIMRRAVEEITVLILEGINDLRFWMTFKVDECHIVNAEGKPNVIAAIERLDGNGHRGVLGIVDSDFDILEGVKISSPNLIRTDCFDLECTISQFNALRRVAFNFGNPTKIRQFEASAKRTINEEIIERAAVIGRIKWAAKRTDITLSITNLANQNFIDEDTWQFRSIDLISSVLKMPDDVDILRREISILPEHDPWLVSNGHDIVSLLRIGLMNVLGDIKPHVSRSSVEASLRASVSREEIEVTDLWRYIKEWERRNTGFRVVVD